MLYSHGYIWADCKFTTRLVVARQKTLASEDDNITAANKRLKLTNDNVSKATTDLSQVLRQLETHPESDILLREAKKAEKRKGVTEVEFAKALASSNGTKGTGTGRVGLLLPDSS